MQCENLDKNEYLIRIKIDSDLKAHKNKIK